MRLIKNKEQILNPLSVFLLFSISGIVLFFIICFFKGQYLLEWLVMENNSDWVMSDYFRHVLYSQYLDKMYDLGIDVAFPPLAYLFYYFIFRITSNGPIIVDLAEMSQQPYQMIIFIMYISIGVMLYTYAVHEIRATNLKKNMLIVSILFSTPMFAGAIERGNMTIYVAALSVIALIWRNSDSRLKKEMALLLIAICAGLKVYPSVLGLLYLKEKRWKEAVRLVIYGILFFFVPFFFFGGIHAVGQYIQALQAFMGSNYVGRIQFFKGMIGFFGIQGKAANICNYLFIILLILFFMRSKKLIRQMGYLAAFMALVPGNAYRYTLLYFLFPVFVLFQNGIDEKNVDGFVNAVLLGSLFSIPTIFGLLTGFTLNYEIYTYTYVERYIYTAAWIFTFYQFWSDIRDYGLEIYEKMKNRRKIK